MPATVPVATDAVAASATGSPTAVTPEMHAASTSTCNSLPHSILLMPNTGALPRAFGVVLLAPDSPVAAWFAVRVEAKGLAVRVELLALRATRAPQLALVRMVLGEGQPEQPRGTNATETKARHRRGTAR